MTRDVARSAPSLRSAILGPLSVAVGAVCVVVAGIAWLAVKDHLTDDQEARARQAALTIQQMSQTIASEEALQRLVQLTAADRHIAQLVIVAGDPLRVVAASRGAWVGGELARLPKDVGADLLDARRPDVVTSRERIRALKWFERLSPESGLPRPAAVVVDIDVTREWHWIEATAFGTAVTVTAVMLLLAGIAHAVVRRKVVEPIERISRAIARRSDGNANARIPRFDAAELGKLSDELNRALDAEDSARAAAAAREQDLRVTLEDLEASKARFEGLIESLPQHVWTADSGGWLDYASKQATDYFGVPLEELMHGQWKRFLHPDDAGKAHAAAAASRERGEPYVVDYRLRRHDGEYRWFSVTAHPIRDAGGTIVKWIGTNTDITDRKRAEAQIHESQKLEAIGQLTGGLAHDFNNLLGIVVGNLDLLGERLSGDPRTRAQHASALEAALRGAEVTRSLLAVARRQPLELSSRDLNAFVEEMLPLLQTSAGPGVELLTHFAPGPLTARVDASGLSNVVLNLVINARDALEGIAGARRITLRTRRVRLDDGEEALAPGWYAVLDVADTGCGMSETVARQAFEPFFTTKAPGRGTGLGLSMVHGYAEQLGGTARIQSTMGAGTTVSVLLPMDAGVAAGQEATEAKRLAALRALDVLDTAPEEAFDAVVAEAAAACEVPMALVSLVDENRQWFKARVGLEARETPREVAFCAHAVLQADEILVVPDARNDPRFSGNPLVTEEPHVRFYAGVPLVDRDGLGLGTLCVIDRVPRTLSADQLQRLEALSGRLVALLEGRSSAHASAPLPPADGRGTSKRPRVLVVDDEPGLCEVACEWLESLGYETAGANSPERALEQLEEGPFDILFTDVMMPGGMDGIALAREAKRRRPGLRILLASGYAQGLVQAVDLPGAFLAKPYRRGDLERAMRTLPRRAVRAS